MKVILLSIGMVFLIGWSPAYAVDCTTTFDQSCLSGEYDAEEVEAANRRSVEKIERRIQEREEYKKSKEYIFNRAMEILNRSVGPAHASKCVKLYYNLSSMRACLNGWKLEAARQEGPEVYKIVYDHVMEQRARDEEEERERRLEELESEVEHLQRQMDY